MSVVAGSGSERAGLCERVTGALGECVYLLFPCRPPPICPKPRSPGSCSRRLLYSKEKASAPRCFLFRPRSAQQLASLSSPSLRARRDGRAAAGLSVVWRSESSGGHPGAFLSRCRGPCCQVLPTSSLHDYDLVPFCHSRFLHLDHRRQRQREQFRQTLLSRSEVGRPATQRNAASHGPAYIPKCQLARRCCGASRRLPHKRKAREAVASNIDLSTNRTYWPLLPRFAALASGFCCCHPPKLGRSIWRHDELSSTIRRYLRLLPLSPPPPAAALIS